MVVLDLGAAGLAFDVIGQHIHRAGPVERDHGDEVFDAVDADTPDQVAHAAGLELEHADRVAAVEQGIGGCVVEGNLLKVDHNVVDLLDQLAGLLEHGQGLESQKIHLEQADFAERLHGVLGDRLLVLIERERDDLDQRLLADHHAGGVGAGVAVESFQHKAVIEDALAVLIVLVGPLEVRVFVERLVQRHLGIFGDHLGELVAAAVGDLQDAAHVANHAFGAERAEGDDLGHAIAAILVFDVLDDLAAAGLAEIDVEVGGGDALGVEKTLKDQFVAQRIDRGDAEGIGHDAAAARAAAGADRDILLARVVHEIPDDQEVVHEAGFLDHAHLVIEAVHDLCLGVGGGVGRIGDVVEAGNAFVTELDQVVTVGQSLGGVVGGEVELAELKLDVAAVGDLIGDIDGARVVAKEEVHLLAALEIELVGPVAHVLGVAQDGLGLQAEQHFVRGGVGFVEVVDVVRGHEREAGLL